MVYIFRYFDFPLLRLEEIFSSFNFATEIQNNRIYVSFNS